MIFFYIFLNNQINDCAAEIRRISPFPMEAYRVCQLFSFDAEKISLRVVDQPAIVQGGCVGIHTYQFYGIRWVRTRALLLLH